MIHHSNTDTCLKSLRQHEASPGGCRRSRARASVLPHASSSTPLPSLFSPPLACLTVWRCRHSTGNKDRSGTKKQGGKPSERSLLRRRCIFDCFFFFSWLICLFPPAAAAAAADAHSQAAEIDSLSQRHDTPSAELSTTDNSAESWRFSFLELSCCFEAAWEQEFPWAGNYLGRGENSGVKLSLNRQNCHQFDPNSSLSPCVSRQGRTHPHFEL